MFTTVKVWRKSKARIADITSNFIITR